MTCSFSVGVVPWRTLTNGHFKTRFTEKNGLKWPKTVKMSESNPNRGHQTILRGRLHLVPKFHQNRLNFIFPPNCTYTYSLNCFQTKTFHQINHSVKSDYKLGSLFHFYDKNHTALFINEFLPECGSINNKSSTLHKLISCGKYGQPRNQRSFVSVNKSSLFVDMS